MHRKSVVVSAVLTLLVAAPAWAMDAELKAKVEARVDAVKAIAAESAVVTAVRNQNQSPSNEVKSMTQDKWAGLSMLDPFVRSLTKTEAAKVINDRKDDTMVEGFVSDADGRKVGFLSKTTNWSHKGKAKHDKPMAGEVWIGEVEVDQSTGAKQVQVAVPILDGDVPIGSMVIGIDVDKL